jgi:hypothetical protein
VLTVDYALPGTTCVYLGDQDHHSAVPASWRITAPLPGTGQEAISLSCNGCLPAACEDVMAEVLDSAVRV